MLKNPNRKTAYNFAQDLIENQEKLDQALQLILKDHLLTDWELLHLKRPNSTYRQRFIAVRDALTRNPDFLHKPKYQELPFLEELEQHKKNEAALQDSLSHPDILHEALSRRSVDIGTLTSINPVDKTGSINHPRLLTTDKGEFFIRYTAGLGGDVFLRYDPRETVLRHVIGEETFRRFLGQNSTTRTLSPTVDLATLEHEAEESPTTSGRLGQRIIVQPSYAKDYFRLEDYQNRSRDLPWVVEEFAKINARIHAATYQSNGILKRAQHRRFTQFQEEWVKQNEVWFRYNTQAEYRDWMENVNWITHMEQSTHPENQKKGPNTDEDIIKEFDALKAAWIKEEIDIEEKWHNTIDLAVDAWAQGAVLTGPDIKPSNSFYNPQNGHVRLFDFDYFAFFDPGYHIGQGLYTMFRFNAQREEKYDPESYKHILDRFMDSYHRELSSQFSKQGTTVPDYYGSREFKEIVTSTSSLSFLYVMMHDMKERALTPLQLTGIQKHVYEMLKNGPRNR